MTILAECLSRTTLLMRDDVRAGVNESVLLDALRNTRIALVADANNLSSHSAQTAFLTAAMLMIRSGHVVCLMAPNVPMLAPQPPLQSGFLIEELTRVGKDILPGIEFMIGEPDGEVDLAIGVGDSQIAVRARRTIRINAEDWVGIIERAERPHPWRAALWPFGALAAAGLAAGEAFKIAMHKVLPYALSLPNTKALFAPTDEARFELAPAGTPFCRDLGEVDCISGGAITNSILYCLARIPAVIARGRIIEPDRSDLTNLNRNMLLLRSSCGKPKAQDLAEMLGGGLSFRPILQRYDLLLAKSISPLASTVVVGVDHIPTRWLVQQATPKWLVIGATTHWSAMASFHSEGLGCAHCLHNEDGPGEVLIPTTACVSFWAGLFAAVYLARYAAGQSFLPEEQQVFHTPFRPDAVFWSAVALREDCPTCRRRSALSPHVTA